MWVFPVNCRLCCSVEVGEASSVFIPSLCPSRGPRGQRPPPLARGAPLPPALGRRGEARPAPIPAPSRALPLAWQCPALAPEGPRLSQGPPPSPEACRFGDPPRPAESPLPAPTVSCCFTTEGAGAPRPQPCPGRPLPCGQGSRPFCGRARLGAPRSCALYGGPASVPGLGGEGEWLASGLGGPGCSLSPSENTPFPAQRAVDYQICCVWRALAMAQRRRSQDRTKCFCGAFFS